MKTRLLLLAILIPFCIDAQLKINEIMSNNASAVMDDAYNYSMWVELCNTSTTTTLNQNSFYLTDELSNLKKWIPQSKALAPGAFNVLWFEREENTGHSNFELNPEGGKLYLVSKSLQVVDSVIYPQQYRNISYGRKTDNNAEWVYFEQFSPGATNNNNLWASIRCDKPVFTVPGGFFKTSQMIGFETTALEDTIYFTKNGSEPTLNSTRYIPGSKITLGISTSTVIRAKIFSRNKLSSDIVTSTYFVNTRDHHLPVVSIATTPANLTDNTIGIYVTGTNGVSGDNGSVANFNQPWERPVNYELFDTAHASCLNQELDISITGAYSRTFALKPLKIKPNKKFGDGRLRYNIFQETKPDLKYKDIMMRNSGNDFYYSMMRDGFNQSLAMHRMDIDLLAYQPAVLYLNGAYYGILNLREETGKSFFYSNYGLNGDEVYEIDKKTIPDDTCFAHLRDYISNNDISTNVVYNKVGEMMDINEFINYNISEIFIANWDWPWNNVKIWKKLNGGKWRWLTYDTDWTFNYVNNQQSYNTLLFVLGEHPSDRRSDWSNLIIRRLKLNAIFCKTFVDRFCIQISSTYKTERVDAMMDSLSKKIATEIIYHKQRWSGSQRTLNDDLIQMKTFSAQRPDYMMGFLSTRFANAAKVQTVDISTNIKGVTYKMNSEPILDSELKLKYFNGWNMQLEANPVFGYKFKQWEISGTSGQELVKMGDTWKYFDGNDTPAVNWNANVFSDAAWKSGPAQFGWGGKGEKTVISYGANSNLKYPTSYYRKTITINDLIHKDKFSLSILVDDGAVVYLNGKELGRYLMAPGIPTFNTLSTSVVANGDLISFDVPKELLKEGENLIAVEVHQANATTSDCVFDARMTCELTEIFSEVNTNPVFSRVLTSDMKLKAIFESSTIVIPDDEATIVLNEMVSGNASVVDEFGGKDDYIELYNTGDKDVNIAGWYLTDTQANPTLSQIPTTDVLKTLVPAKGRIILWADGETLQGVLHLGFKLSKDGESVFLSRKNSSGNIVTVDSVDCPALESEMSYSRIPDGGLVWSVAPPTYNSKNSEFVSVVQPHSNIDIYPTQVTESFTVQNGSGMLLIMADLTGKVVYRSIIQSDTESISTSNFQRGLYLISVGNQRFKIIKR